MPDLYKPSQPRRVQAVRSVRGRGAVLQRWRWWWPIVGVLPVLTVAVLATRGVFAPGPSAPSVASAPAAAPTAVTRTQGAPAPTQVGAGSQSAPAPATTTAPSATTTTTTASTTAAGASPAATSSSAGASTEAALSSGTPTAGGPYVAYRVQPGDTLRFVAHMYGVSAASIAQASGLTNPDLVRVGQVLTIPAEPGWLYRIQPGETLDQVASRTGVASERIVAASGLTIASVGAGSVILIPDQAAAASK